MFLKNLYTEEEINIIRLYRSENVGINTFHKILKTYKTATNFINNSFTFKSRKPIIIEKKENVLDEIEKTTKFKSKIITFLDPLYPKLLMEVPQFPPLLTVKGNIDILKNEKTLAIIGSRTCSINNFNFTKKIASELGKYGYTIVSGLARGIDSAAHRGSIKTGTIAVMAGGISKIYPKEHEELYYEIIENNGCIITEMHFECPPRPEMFPLRNRIIAGLSKGVLVVDAGLMSGSLHTAGQAIEFNRELMVFPGNPYDDRCNGSNKLIQQGANMVIDTRDIIECLENFSHLNNFFPNSNIETNTEENIKINTEENIKINTEENLNTNKNQKNSIERENIQKQEILTNEIYEIKPNEKLNANINIDYNENNIESKKANNIEDVILLNLSTTPTNTNDLIDKMIEFFPINKINSTLMKLKLQNKIIFENNKIFLSI